MLRINLLPVRQLKKRAKARNQIISAIVALCSLLVLLGIVGILQKRTISATQTTIADLTKKKDAYGPMLAEIEMLKNQKQELERKTAVINKLRTESSITVRVLDEVAKNVDNSRLWLESLSQQSASLSLTGVALDNETVAQFMDKLKASKVIADVNLTSSSLKVISGRSLKSFVMTCSIALNDTEEVAVTKK
jgi:type IV pilus assembly protein PilN